VVDRDLKLIREHGAPPVPLRRWYRVDGLDGPDVFVHFAEDEQGRNVVDTVLVTGGRILSDHLRDTSVGQIERLANTPAEIDAERFIRELTPLARRSGEPPEEFANRVAWYYRIFSAASRSPAKAIAETSNVPVGTVRWWIREARRLGALPPGRRGSVG